MALKLVPLLCVAASLVLGQEYQLICDNSAASTVGSNTFYRLREGSKYCYRFFRSAINFFEANRTCIRENAFLLRIDSREENDYVRTTFPNDTSFWIGLTDLETEGIFKWIDGVFLQEESYQWWLDGSATIYNLLEFDCVEFTPEGWRVRSGFCANEKLPYVCRQKACNSTDGVNCISPSEGSTSLSAGVIVAIVLIPIVIIVCVGIVLFLVLMWKFQNDIFNKYICCCAAGGSKAQVNSLKQEIQRLQTELSQHKLSSSGKFSQGQLSRQVTQTSLFQPASSMQAGKGFQRSFSLSTNNRITSVGTRGVTPVLQGMNRSGSVINSMKPPLPPLQPVVEEKKQLDSNSPVGEFSKE